MKHEFKLLAIIMSVFLIGVFLQDTMESSKSNFFESLEESFEIISELFSIFVAFSIFAITWHSYSRSRDEHSLFLGSTFLITGFIILFHLLSYPFMPDFITSNSAHKSAIFFLESRFILAVLILASVFVQKDSLPELINRRVMVLLMTAIVSVSMVSVLFHNNSLLMGYDLDTFSTETVTLLFIISIIFLVACYLYAKRAKETGQNDLHFLIYGSLILLISNLVYFFYEFSGHFLIITGFFFFYFGSYKSSVELPYEKLAIAEENLCIRAENKYRNLFDNANDAIITTDIQDRVTSWNRSAEKFFGWEGKEVMGKKLSELIILGQSESGIETVHIHETGNRIFVSLTISQLLDSDDKLTGLSFIIHDITERKKAEQMLRASEEKYSRIFDKAPIGISHFDKNSLVTACNEYLAEILGTEREKIIGINMMSIINDEQQKAAILKALSGKIGYCEGEYVSVTGKKQSVLRTIYAPLFSEDGSIIGGISITDDISERKRAEKIIEDSLHEKETLLREIHHRVKNNMQIISSLLLLQSQNIIDQKYLDIFNDSNNRILSMSLIHEKLYQSENLAQINIQEYINDLASNLVAAYGGKGNAELEIKVDNIPLNINFAVPCGLILNELITNSLKYAFPGGRHGKIKIVFKKMDGNMIFFSVSDNGIGIPRDMDIRATKSLGMHLINALAENQLHGEIILNRERGTDFQINFKGE